MSTIFGCVPAKQHSQAGHPENAQRVSSILAVLETESALQDLTPVVSSPASVHQLYRTHSRQLIDQVQTISLQGGGHLDADTYTTSASYEEARLAAGTACHLVDLVMEGSAENGLGLIRPPGHHAQFDRVGGFCLFNNIAVAARHALAEHNVERVVIIDYDVHHGNGTQDIFYEDPSVLYISLHLYYPFFYPGTGALSETGAGTGKGANLNVPFRPGAGDRAYELVFKEVIGPRIRQFEPDLILVSAGFDAHWADPLAFAALSLSGYAAITRYIAGLAADLCAGRQIYLLEGGYHLEALAYGVLNVIHTLAGRDSVIDPLGSTTQPEPNITDLLYKLQVQHLLS